MKPREEIKAIFTLLKAHLRVNHVSYLELSKRLNMSESNLKRIFSTYNCGFEQMAKICEASGISLFELTNIAAKAHSTTYRLSDDAEEFFLKNFDCFIFYRNLGVGSDPNANLSKLKNYPRENSVYLKDLERLGLIEILDKKIEIKNFGYLDISKTPRLAKKLEEKWVPWFFKQIRNRRENNESQHFLKMGSTGLSRTHQIQLKQELEFIWDKYRELGLRDQFLGAKEFDSVGICIGIGPYRPGLFENSEKKDFNFL